MGGVDKSMAIRVLEVIMVIMNDEQRGGSGELIIGRMV